LAKKGGGKGGKRGGEARSAFLCFPFNSEKTKPNPLLSHKSLSADSSRQDSSASFFSRFTKLVFEIKLVTQKSILAEIFINSQ
jgi:hypothetical protein